MERPKVILKSNKSRLEIKIGQKFDPSKPSRLKDTGVLTWGIFSKMWSFFLTKKWFKIGKKFKACKPSSIKDTGILGLGIFHQNWFKTGQNFDQGSLKSDLKLPKRCPKVV